MGGGTSSLLTSFSPPNSYLFSHPRRHYIPRTRYHPPILTVSSPPSGVDSSTFSSNPSLIFIDVLIQGKPLRTMIDTGASRLFLHRLPFT